MRKLPKDQATALKVLRKGAMAWREWRGQILDEIYSPLRPGDHMPDEPVIDLSGVNFAGEALAGFDFYCVSLRGANLKGCDLSHSDFSAADLSAAHLESAKIDTAKFVEADLRQASLRNCYLCNCQFSDADLSDANCESAMFDIAYFGSANLNHVSFRGSGLSAVEFNRPRDLRGADFTHARISDCIFVDSDLSAVKGLSTIRHGGPSTIGIDTLFKSRGEIPVKFLSGCGVPDSLIKQAPDLFKSTSTKFYSSFISHSSRDGRFCVQLYKSLQGAGIRTWYFPVAARWGRNVWGEIASGIRSCDKVIVVCSKHSLKSGPVLREIDRTLEREARESKEILFPIRLDDYLFQEWKHPLRNDVINRVVGNFSHWSLPSRYEEAVNNLISNLESKRRQSKQPIESARV